MAEQDSGHFLSVEEWSDSLFNKRPLTPRQRKAMLREREMERLRGYLARPRWPSEDAVWILAGLDPELTMGGPGYWGFEWLPGGRRREWLNADGSIGSVALEEQVTRELQEVRSFILGEAEFPSVWIGRALAKRYRPPWLDDAIMDPQCSAHLRELSFSDSTPTKESRRRGGSAKAERSFQKQVRLAVVEAWDEWKASGQSYPSKDAFIRAMNDKYLDMGSDKEAPYVEGQAPYVTGPRTIRAWVNALDQCQSSGITPKRILEDRLELERNRLQSA